MKTFVWILALQLFGLGCYAQQNTLDSISNIIASYPSEDSLLVDLRNDFARKNIFINPTDSTLIDFNLITVNIAKKIHYLKGELMANERLGLVYQYVASNPYLALDYYQKALTVAKDNPNLVGNTIGIMGNIGNIYYEQEEYKQALTSFRKVLNYNNDLKLPAIANIANIYGKMNQPDSAIIYFEKALSLAEEQKNYVFQANCLSNLSLINNSIGHTKQAIEQIEKSLKLIQVYNISYVRTMAFVNAATIYLSDKEYNKAEKFALEALDLENSVNNLPSRQAVWGTLADIYEAQKRYPESLHAYRRYMLLKDSLTSIDRKVEISRKEMQYEYDSKETLLKSENEKNQALATVEIDKQKDLKNIYIFSGSGILLTALFGLVAYKRKRDAVAQKQAAEFSATVSDTELKALRAQLNPHFIYNSLNSIGDYISKNDTEEAYDYLSTFARLMRQTLENSTHREITLKEDLEFVELYLQVERKRLSEKFTYDIFVDNEIDTQNTLVPPLMLQPFIENSIWHGFNNKEGMGEVKIEIKLKQNTLICCVDDNGVGRINDSVAKRKGSSLGIQITEKRLAILNKQKHTDGQLTIIDKEGGQGVRIELSLPLLLAF